MDNFRKLEGFNTSGFSSMKSGQDKGHGAMFGLISKINKEGGAFPIEWQSIKNTHLACFAALESLQSGAPVIIG
jgi:hypothetical protein